MGTGENRHSRFESVDLSHMRPLPDRRWQRTQWRKNTVHPDYHIAVSGTFTLCPTSMSARRSMYACADR